MRGEVRGALSDSFDAGGRRCTQVGRCAVPVLRAFATRHRCKAPLPTPTIKSSDHCNTAWIREIQ